MSLNETNASRTIQTACQAVLQKIRWAEAKWIPREEQDHRHLDTKSFIEGQLEIIRGTVTEGVLIPRWMVALDSAFRTLGNALHPDYQALSQGRIPIPPDHPWLQYTVRGPPAPIVPSPSQEITTVPQPARAQPPAPAAPSQPPAAIPAPPHAPSTTPSPSTEPPRPAAKGAGTRPAPTMRRKAVDKTEAGNTSGTTPDARKQTEKTKGKEKEISESTPPIEKRQDKGKKRQSQPETMEIDDADDTDDIQVIEPEQVRGRGRGRRSARQRSPSRSRPTQSKPRPRSPSRPRATQSKPRPRKSDPDPDRTPTSTSPGTDKPDCANCVRFNRTCEKQEGLACKTCQQNKQKCEHSAKKKRRGAASNTAAPDPPPPPSAHRRTSVKRPSSASESRDSDDNEESSNQDASGRQRKKKKVGEDSENPLDDPRQTIIVPGPRAFAGVDVPRPPNYPRQIVPTARPPTARPTRSPNGGRTGPAILRPNLRDDLVSKADFDALMERVRTLEQAFSTFGRAVGSEWPQDVTIGPKDVSDPAQSSTNLSGDAPPRPLSPRTNQGADTRPSTPENQGGQMQVSSPTPRATSAQEGLSRHATPLDRPTSPTTGVGAIGDGANPPTESSGSVDPNKGGCLEGEMEGVEVSEPSG